MVLNFDVTWPFFLFKKKNPLFSLTVTTLTLHNHRSLFFSLFFFSQYYLWYVSFPVFSRKKPESKFGGGGVKCGSLLPEEKRRPVGGMLQLSTWLQTTMLVATGVTCAHKGSPCLLKHVRVCPAIPSRNQLSNFTLKKRLLRCNKFPSLAI